MSRIGSIGPTAVPNEPRSPHSLGQAIDYYAGLLSHPNPANTSDLQAIAQKTVELRDLAQSVMNAASSTLRGAANDIEKLLQSPLSVPGMPENVSILAAAEHYLRDPATAELGPLVQELCYNSFALGVMCNELTLLSGSIKNQSGLGT